jgi:16S rRNA (guanine527-N7)-methyltransferase
VSGRFDEALRVRAASAGVQLTDAHISQLRVYYELLARWTQTINLTSFPLAAYPPASIDRLLIEPLLAARFFRSETPRWIDLGSGGGSPAVPLRVIETGGSLEMVESRERKTAFLREVVRVLQLERTEVRTTRIEEFAASASQPAADLVTMRAVRPTSTIVQATARILKPAGRLLVFGTRESADLDAWIGDAELYDVESAPLLEPQHRLYILTRR